MKAFRRILACLLAAALVLSSAACIFAAESDAFHIAITAVPNAAPTPSTLLSPEQASRLQSVLDATAAYIQRIVKAPQISITGGEWAILGLARSGCQVPEEYYSGYYAKAAAQLEAAGGKLHETKHTDYSRVVLAMSALGKNAQSIEGFDLTYPLGDYNKTVAQGINGAIWALIALDSRNYEIPENKEAKTQATRQLYIDRIVSVQLSGGGWSLTGNPAEGRDEASDADVTGMALQALSKYQKQPAVKAAIDKALACIEANQDENGALANWGASSAESYAQLVTALCELGISPYDSRFSRNGKSLADYIFDFYIEGSGFKRSFEDSVPNQLSTEQCFYALVALKRFSEGKSSLYSMSDPISIGELVEPPKGSGLPNKHADIKPMPVMLQGVSFGDVTEADNKAAIEALAARDIVHGTGGSNFTPHKLMSRAEFCAIVVQGLGLEPRLSDEFSDVSADKWYAPYVGAAKHYGLVSGVGGGRFNPDGSISKQEAGKLLANAAKLCGMDIFMESYELRDMLSQFGDYVNIASWAAADVAFCYAQDIFDQSELNTEPLAVVSRCQMAQMFYNMLLAVNLI